MTRLREGGGRTARPPRMLSVASWPAVPGRWPAAERLADAGLLAFAAGLGALSSSYLWHAHGELLDAADLAAGGPACLALWWRRGRPVLVAVLALCAGAFSPLADGACLVAVYAAGARARGRALIPVVAAGIAASIVFPLVNPTAGEVFRVGFPAFLCTLIAFSWGLYLRARRELVASLRQRAEQLEADQLRNAELAREAERRGIAREMHDVLAHRLSLLSLHAGALEFHPDAPAAEVASAAAVIRTSASAALNELREIITVLREEPDYASALPQPGFGQLDRLLDESRSAGMTVRGRIDVPNASELPDAVGRAVYRVIQEGLTNARKHAPGAPVEVDVASGQAGLTIEVISRRPVAAPAAPSPPAPAGSGTGLIGLAERLALSGGDLEYETTPGGDFVLRARLPGQR